MKKYIEYDISEKTEKLIDAETAKSYGGTGYKLYRPLPCRAVTSWDIIKYCAGDLSKKDAAATLVLTLLGSLTGLLIPYLTMLVYDIFIPWASEAALLRFGGMIIAFSAGSLLFATVKNMVAFRLSVRLETSLQSAVYHRLFLYPENAYMKYASSDLAERAASVSGIAESVTGDIITSVMSVIFSLLYLFVMLAYYSRLAVISAAMVLAHMLFLWLINLMCAGLEVSILQSKIESRQALHQIIKGIAKIKIAYAENRILLHYIKPYAKAKKETAKRNGLLYLSENINALLAVVYMLVMYYLVSRDAAQYRMGNFMAFTAAFGVFSASMLQVIRSLGKWRRMKPALAKAKTLFDLAPEVSGDDRKFSGISGNIEASGVSFRYDENGAYVLSDISFNIRKGEYIGIVGASGSGKSTLFRLLLGFNKPESGTIYYDGSDIDTIDKRELRKNLGVVLQDGQLMASSIYDNIVIASAAATLEEKDKETRRVWEAVEGVGLLDDILKMPMGLETIVSENSGSISGGQKQRILIARAIFGSPKVLYFDEATSALDNRSQAVVTSSMEKLKVTRVVIAHRLSTVKGCDRIFVIDKGRIVETGSYDELMEMKGWFYKLARRQSA